MTLEKLRCVVDWKKDKNKLKEFGAGPYFKNEATSGFEMANFTLAFPSEAKSKRQESKHKPPSWTHI